MVDLNALVGIASDAAVLLKDYYRGALSCDTRHKADASPVTTADLAVNQWIVDALTTKWPAIPVLSEESAEQPVKAPTFWCVDPLDGTRGFIERNDEFSINIALIEDGRPTVGVVWIPMRDQGYAATLNGEAWLLGPSDHKVAIQTRAWPGKDGIEMVSRHHHQPCQFDGIAHSQPMGSALKACVIAQGLSDLYWRKGPTSWWDTAAFQCVVEAAGGGVFDRQGQPLRYLWGESVLNPSFLVLGDCQRLGQCLQSIGS